MTEPLPLTNRCQKCGEWFHTVHVCPTALERLMKPRTPTEADRLDAAQRAQAAEDMRSRVLLGDARDCCDHCDDGDGHSVFPYYGMAPHTHALPTPTHPTDWIGSTRLLPREQWSDNFREDPECEGHGVYMRCPKCGRGEQPAA